MPDWYAPTIMSGGVVGEVARQARFNRPSGVSHLPDCQAPEERAGVGGGVGGGGAVNK